MKKASIYAAIFALSCTLPVTAQVIHRVSASGELPSDSLSIREVALVSSGESLLSAGNFPAAEEDFRSAMAVSAMRVPGFDISAERGLAETLAAMGKTEEAFQLYRTIIYAYPRSTSSVAQESRSLMRFALLLSQTGQWAEAVSLYNKALSNTTYGDAPKLDMRFDQQVPMPQHLQALAHVACGMEFSGHGQNIAALKEFASGHRIAPDSPLTNYYYGQGWQKLSPTERAQFGTAQQARAALQKAVKLGKGDVKLAAAKALKSFS